MHTSVTVTFVARSRSWARSMRTLSQIRGGSLAVRRREAAQEMEARHGGSRGEAVEVERFGVVPIGEVAGPTKMNEQVDGHTRHDGDSIDLVVALDRPSGRLATCASSS
jgi:hypothetical protein